MPNKDGIMLIDKPAGMTSHDVVDYLRRYLQTKRIGHIGILDPNATGLLVMLIGQGTLFSAMLMGLGKRYVARMEFGVATDTYDSDGKITRTGDPGTMTKSDFEKLLMGFKGEIEQLVPVYSAAKRDGKTMHKMARKGKAVTPGHKVVRIDDINIIDFGWPEVALDIKCASGTYVRSIAHQLGEIIGCGGHLKKLRRMEVGQFKIASAVTLEEVSKSDNPTKYIMPLMDALPMFPAISIKPEYFGAVLNGRPLMKKYITENNYSGKGGELSLLLGPEEKVLALARLNMLWASVKSLGPSEIMGTYVRVIDEGHLRDR